MRSLKALLPVLVLSILLSSCTNDDPLAKVKYQISGFDNSITQIKYNIVGGGSITVTNLSDFGNGGGDSRTLNAYLLPFDAKLEVAANNATSANKQYVLKIIVDNQTKASYTIDVPPGGSSSGEVTYTVEAN